MIKHQQHIKYCLDRIVALALLILLSPFFLIIMFTICLEDRGDIFFRQQRLGRDGHLFRIWKFRSMVKDADKLLETDGSVAVNRITRVGRLLRALSLDELPQLINILKGEMSFIGPRPALPEHLSRYTEVQKGRLAVKPGVTGLAQIQGRNTLPWSKRIFYDLEYIDKYSLWLDFKIFLKTIKVVLYREGISLDRNPQQVDDLAPLPSRQAQRDNAVDE